MRRRGAGTVLISALLCALFASAAHAAPAPVVKVLSNRADLISGGDALAAIELSAAADASKLKVDVDGRDVTAAFAKRSSRRFVGLVTGLRLGRNVLTARAGSRGARIAIVNHPIGGPVLSGPQVQPWQCQDTAKDKKCNQPIEYEYQYKSSVTGQFQP